ncbi:hypothetical protein DY000_02003856 [Brassica cretica]|uniref:Thioredoxin domain-containing protein n=1 Tax=Brassica cretica TaxID=69181 RepID=A0ABQ7BT68_BRACR|nr:hypothetical protein DY000_02003856 [Brassica cretica]
MASALRRTASRLRHRLRSSSVLLSPPCISDALRQGVDSSLPRPDPTVVLIRNTNVVPEKTFVERRCLDGGIFVNTSGFVDELLLAVCYWCWTGLIGRRNVISKEGPSAGKAAIGGPFSLIRDDGKRVTEKDLMGKWTILYFGFTHCPDICPDELIKLSASIDKIKEKSGVDVVPVFISVDPERDTDEQVHEYVKEFHSKLVGLTGSPEEIKSVARSYRVYYMKTEEEDSDYLVDHSIVMYLMSPEMSFVKFYGKNHDVDSLTDGVVKEIRQYRK